MSVLIFCWIFAIIVSSPFILFMEYNDSNRTKYEFPMNETTNEYSNETNWCGLIEVQISKIYFLVFVSFFIFVPTILLVPTYSFIIKNIYSVKNLEFLEKSVKNAEHVSKAVINQQIKTSTDFGNSGNLSSMKAKKKQTLKLCAISLFFFFCVIPIKLFQILKFLIDIESLEVTHTIFLISKLLFYTHIMSNPIIYNLMSSKFSKAFKNVLFCKYFRCRCFLSH
jgi:hypothetical protein